MAMATTTIRIDKETHARLVELSEQRGDSLIGTVRDAAEALRRQQFATDVNRQIRELRRNPDTWAEYLADSESTSVTDGIG